MSREARRPQTGWVPGRAKGLLGWVPPAGRKDEFLGSQCLAPVNKSSGVCFDDRCLCFHQILTVFSSGNYTPKQSSQRLGPLSVTRTHSHVLAPLLCSLLLLVSRFSSFVSLPFNVTDFLFLCFPF